MYAVELVYIPQGAYYLGSGSTTATARFRDGASDTYLNITSENAITVGTAAGNIFGYGSTDMSAGSIPATYPKGYNAFWIMNHEMSQQCYVDFLNTLDLAGSTVRNIGGYTGTHPALVAPFPERAIETLSSTDLLSWLDWAAMRPFTEMEYEKACRGANITPVPNEYAWGNTALTGIGTMTNAGTNNEAFTIGNCNYYYYTLVRPMRVGALATLTSTRISSGATYYGVMEMSGNVYERAIAAGYTQGRAFNGLHGDGKLSTSFDSNVANWAVGGSGLTFKGGSWGLNTPAGYATLAVSDRASASAVNDTRGLAYGGRGARTAE